MSSDLTRLMYDRVVHARLPDGAEIVRYDRAGKWFLEYPVKSLKPRTKLTVNGAVELVLEHERKEGFMLYRDRAGGMAFNARLNKIRKAQREAARSRAGNPQKASPEAQG